jgi:hypothetical protein
MKMITCRDFERLFQKYLAGETTPDEAALLDGHATSCVSCRRLLDECRRVEEAVADSLRTRTSHCDARSAVLAELSRAGSAIEPLSVFTRLRRPAAFAAAALVAVSAAFFLGASYSTGGRVFTSAARAPWTVGDLDGTVLLKHPGASAWTEVKADGVFRVGDEILALPRSSISLKLPDNATLRLSGSGVLTVTKHNGGTTVALSHGTMRATFPQKHAPFEVSTPTGLVRALGTDFEVTVK